MLLSSPPTLASPWCRRSPGVGCLPALVPAGGGGRAGRQRVREPGLSRPLQQIQEVHGQPGQSDGQVQAETPT